MPSWIRCLCAVVVAAANNHPRCEASVRLSGSASRAAPVVSKDPWEKGAAAGAYLEETLLETGWDVFEVSTDPAAADQDQSFAAGYLEGFLMGAQTAQNYHNMWRYYFKMNGNKEAAAALAAGGAGPLPSVYRSWAETQFIYATAQASVETEDIFWRQASLLLDQFNGQIAGLQAFLDGEGTHPCKTQEVYSAASAKARADLGGASAWEVATLLNAFGDFMDLQAVLDNSTAPYDPSEFKNWLYERSMCSAVIKVLPDLSEIMLGHTTWFTYTATHRVYKHYHIHTMMNHTAASSSSFSSYAGTLESQDDFYLLSSGLLMTQTSLTVIDPDLHRQAQPEALFSWQRVRIANALSRSGEDWYHFVRRENSGTYNNEYMIVDSKKFVPGKPLQKGLLWVVEQIPNRVEGADVTHLLEYGYFPSFNVPFFPKVWEEAGYAARYAETQDPKLSHATCSRAQIFRRDHAAVTDINGMSRLLRSNDYLRDPMSLGNPSETVCSRGDLMTGNPVTFGGTDLKVSSVSLAKSLTSIAKSGPTLGTDSRLPIFKWSDFPNEPSDGLPREYNFPDRVMRPAWQDARGSSRASMPSVAQPAIFI